MDAMSSGPDQRSGPQYEVVTDEIARRPVGEDLPAERLETLRLMGVLDEQCGSIRGQIEHSRALWKETGETDPRWYARARYALRAKGRQRQALQTRLGEINRRIRERDNLARETRQERMFIAECRRLLPRETWEQIWRAVRERADGDKNEAEAER
jgi:hypothetical protein